MGGALGEGVRRHVMRLTAARPPKKEEKKPLCCKNQTQQGGGERQVATHTHKKKIVCARPHGCLEQNIHASSPPNVREIPPRPLSGSGG
mmetsp:Transcript_25659/g.63235  ORF Transcript_25659/g.63235 Transcript_25659/m.63235 type:complete len:89 (-) Transcript_25659:577-843(-)